MSEQQPKKSFPPLLRYTLIALGLALLGFAAVQVVRVWNGAGDPVAIRLGPLMVRWYGIILMCGALLGSLLGEGEARRRGWDPDHVWNLLLWGLIAGVAVARLWYVLGAPDLARDPLAVVGFVNGQFVGLQGLAIHGALIGAVGAALVYTAVKRQNFFAWIDVGAVGFVLGQAVGRWGNFFNHEAYGPPTTLPWGLIIPAGYRIYPYTDMARYPLQTRFHPTFLYESLWNLAVCALLLYLSRRYEKRMIPGEVFWLYGMMYGFGRFFLEFLRTDSMLLPGSLPKFPAAQAVSVALFLVCGALLAARRWVWRRQTYAEIVVKG